MKFIITAIVENGAECMEYCGKGETFKDAKTELEAALRGSADYQQAGVEAVINTLDHVEQS